MHYIIGDVHGHYDTLKKLMNEIEFDGANDIVYYVGDLINGDTKNVEVLDFIMDLGDSAVTTLGNHDLSALAVYFGTRRKSSHSTIGDILDNSRCDDYFDWMRHQKMAHRLEDGSIISHAGISSSWDFEKTMKMASKVENELRSENPASFFTAMFQSAPNRWELCESEMQKKVYAVNVLTRQRVVEEDGGLEFEFKSVLEDLPSSLTPWYTYRKSVRSDAGKEGMIYFGHWSALGYHKDFCATCLDSGVRWGGPLTALRLEDGRIFQAKA